VRTVVPRTKNSRVRDFLLYVAIGISLIVLIVLYGNYQIAKRQSPGLPVKWLGFGVMTALIFWWAIRAYRPFWKKTKFWGSLTLFSVFHFSLGILILLKLARPVGLIDFAVATVLESYGLTVYLGWFLNREP
jgi:hypothetical protein